MKKSEGCIDSMDISLPILKKLLKEIIWINREILPEHLRCFKGIKIIKARAWTRSTGWDNILGYFDPATEYIKLHESLLGSPELRLIEDILIAMGESLLGNYFLWKKVRPLAENGEALGNRCLKSICAGLPRDAAFSLMLS